jgi:antitoxin VapB
MPTHIARTFKSGNSEAVRLPKGIGFGPGTEVRIEREGNRVVLTCIEGEADRWQRDATKLIDDLRRLRSREVVERDRRDPDWWPERPGL